MQLMNEGTIVYRPVPAFVIEKDVYLLGEDKDCDHEDEVWEFLPGDCVAVEERNLQNGKKIYVAVRLA